MDESTLERPQREKGGERRETDRLEGKRRWGEMEEERMGRSGGNR